MAVEQTREPGVAGDLTRRALLQRVGRWNALCLGGCVPLASAQAQAVSPMTESLHDPRAWLLRIHEAASRLNYQGTLVFSSGGEVSSARVAHFADGSQQLERFEALDGEPRSMLRVNDTVHTLWARPQVMVVEQRDAQTRFPGLLSGGERRVLAWYELQVLGHDRVAGYETDVVLLRARDANRYSQRLWADRRTGLLLRADILGPQGQVMESAAFSELAIGGRPLPELVLGPLKRLDGWRVLRPLRQPTALEAEGWQMTALPAGFREVGCARRVLDPAAATALQVVFSDGLTHVSLFIEPFSPQRHQAEAAALNGATQTIMFRRESNWITAVGDVPVETLRRFSAALERRR